MTMLEIEGGTKTPVAAFSRSMHGFRTSIFATVSLCLLPIRVPGNRCPMKTLCTIFVLSLLLTGCAHKRGLPVFCPKCHAPMMHSDNGPYEFCPICNARDRDIIPDAVLRPKLKSNMAEVVRLKRRAPD